MDNITQNILDEEILAKGKEVHTESYSMSIGEVKNLYEDKELDLHPEFQRFFRWSDEQKYKLIESILLGIPLPSFFVYQAENGIWDVVDGLQRLSTIFEFMGVLKDEDDKLLPALKMKGTKYLPSLEGRAWDGATDEDSFSDSLKRDFKRKKIDFNIILKHSDASAKYELFERLNTGGSSASSQEVRNALLIRENREVFKKIDTLSENENFIQTINLSDTLLDERFDLELISRFIIFRDVDLSTLAKTTATDYLTDELLKRAADDTYNWDNEVDIFTRTFNLIYSTLGENSFRKYNVKKGKLEGGFIVSAFEIIALGVAYNISTVESNNIDIKQKVDSFWQAKESGEINWSGRNTTDRLLRTLAYGRELFKQ